MPKRESVCSPVQIVAIAVAVERIAHLVEVVGVELAGVVELVVVHQVAETVDRAAHLAAVGSFVCSGWYPPGTNRVIIGPRAQIPRDVFILSFSSRSWARRPRSIPHMDRSHGEEQHSER